MEKLTKDISNIIITEAKNINEKVRGLNFLELLKTNLIEKLLLILSQKKIQLDKEINYANEIEEDLRIIKISINYFVNSQFISKRKLDNDSLFLAFNDTINFDIYKDQKKFSSMLLYKNSGISLPKDTIINSKYNKNLLLIEIANKNIDQILTK